VSLGFFSGEAAEMSWTNANKYAYDECDILV